MPLLFLLLIFFQQDETDIFSDAIVTNSSKIISCKIISIEGRRVTYLAIRREQLQKFVVLIDTVKEIRQGKENLYTSIKRDSIVSYYYLKNNSPGLSKTIDSTQIESELTLTDSSETIKIKEQSRNDFFDISFYWWIIGGSTILVLIIYLII